ncbi:MAG: amidohydrolase [Alphaproteobacteria bacterium]|nr:amidohydrolase [Alphaproteobacteria bacterium]
MPAATDPASIVLRGGTVLTLDGQGRRTTAIAIRGDRIVAVGDDSIIAPLIGPATRIVELDGRTVIPGFNDAHAHMDREGLKLRRLSLAGCRSIADIVGRIASAARTLQPGEWIVTMPVGEPPHYFDPLKTLAEGRLPNRHELDRAAPANPVYIQGVFGNWGKPPGYSALNSRALALNAVTRDTRPRYSGIEIEKDASGELTGIIVESNPRPAVEFDLLRAVPRFTLDDRVEGIVDSMRIYNAVGTTSVYEGHGVSAATLAAYRRLWEARRLTVRTALVLSPTWADFAEATRACRDWLAFARGRGLGDEWLSVSGVHIAWGGSRVLADIARADLPNTGWSGFVEQANSPSEFRDYCFLLAENDLRLNVIVSDQLHEVMPILEEVAARHPLAARRWVIQHVARSRRTDLERLKALGLIVTTIPVYFLWKGGQWYLNDADGGDSVVPHRDLLDLGIPTATATDNIPYDPFFTLWAMTARQERTTGREVGPRQRIGNEEALRMLTVAAAHLTFEEDRKGPLRPGNFADLAVLSADPTAVAPADLLTIRAALTLVGGRIVHDAAGLPSS